MHIKEEGTMATYKNTGTRGRNARAAKMRERRKKQRRRRLIIIGVEVVLMIILAGCCYVVSMMGLLQRHVTKKSDVYKPSYETATDEKGNKIDYSEELEKGYRNILVIGVDARDNESLAETGTNADVMMIVSINNETKDIKLVSVYRDTYLKMADGNKEYEKANYQMSVGYAEDVMNMLNMNLDLNIEEYVIVNWSAVAKAVDLLGGVDNVEITQELLDKGQIDGYITSVVENTGIPGVQLKVPGTYTLSGVQAVAYCRVRYVGYDYGRTQRQREIVTKMFDKLKADFLDKASDLAKAVFPNIATNIPLVDILSLASHAADYNIGGQTGFPFDKYAETQYIGSVPVSYPVVPVTLESNVEKLHKYLFNVKKYNATTKVKEISQYIEDQSDIHEGKVPTVDIEELKKEENNN